MTRSRFHRDVMRCGALFLGLASIGCRDGVAPFSPVPIDADTGALRRLTFNTMPDVNPTWNATSDTVYYTARGFVDFPGLAHTMLRMAVEKGPTARLAPDAQPGNSGSIMLPVLSPDKSSFAYVSLPPMLGPTPCAEPVGQPYSCANTEPLLVPGSVRVRSVGARGAATADPGVTLPLPGVDPARALGVTDAVYVQRLFPFQKEYVDRSAMYFRPTWAPDSRRVAFSDGLMLRVWDTATNASAAIGNTADGVSPAWHPSGEQIAFARLLRGDSLRFNCNCTEIGSSTPIQHQRWTYTVSKRVITLINADGTGAMELTQGEEPAWSPDGNSLYFVRDNQIYRIARAGGAPVLIARTLGARTPSVSPDGKWLAFARPTFHDEDPDIWILRIDPQ